MEYLQEENNRLAAEYKIEKQKNTWYRFCMEKVFECTSILFNFPVERLKSICSKFIESTKKAPRLRGLDIAHSDIRRVQLHRPKRPAGTEHPAGSEHPSGTVHPAGPEYSAETGYSAGSGYSAEIGCSAETG